MSSFRNASVYIFIGLLLLAGILIFAFKGSLLAYFSEEVFGTSTPGEETVLAPSVDGLVNVEILANDSFKNLKNNVQYFDFNHVGKPVPSSGASLQPPVWQPVYLGNQSPFLVPTAVKTETTEKVKK